MNLFATDHSRAQNPVGRCTKIILASLGALMIVATGFFIRHIGGPRVVARAVAPDGTEMCVVQQCNWNAEPFTTSFVYRKRGAAWRRFYYDHQDDYWGRASVKVDSDNKLAVFYRGDSPAVTFDWATETYTLHRWQRVDRDAQRMPIGWSPE